jgi:hypothetical protein
VGTIYGLTPRLGSCPSGYLDIKTGKTFDFLGKGFHYEAGCFFFGDVYNNPSLLSDCPAGYTNNGLTCGKGGGLHSAPSVVANCPEGTINLGWTCQPKIMGRGFGVVGDDLFNYTCPSGWTERGIGSAGWCDRWSGTYPWEWKVETQTRTTTPKNNPMPSYSKSVGNVVSNPPLQYIKIPLVGNVQIGGPKWEKCGLLYYPKCPSGWHATTCNICERDGGIKGADDMTCPTGYDGPKWTPIGMRCYKQCGEDQTNVGEFCMDNIHTIWDLKQNTCPSGYYIDHTPFTGVGRCYKSCKPGYIRGIESCFKWPDWKGNEARECGANEIDIGKYCVEDCNKKYNVPGKNWWEMVGTSCQGKATLPYQCPAGYEPYEDGKCRRICPPGWIEDGSACLKPHSLGLP